MRLEGIEAYRVILHLYDANAIVNFGREDYGSHAVIALRASDGKFYYCDVEQTSGSEIYEKYFQILVTAKEQAPYHDPIDKIWNHLDYGEEFPMELLWKNINYNGKCVFFEDEQALRAMVDEFLAADEPKTQLDVFSIGKTGFDVISVLDSYENLSFAVIGGVGDFYEYLIKVAD
jgi:hypothetical protein